MMTLTSKQISNNFSVWEKKLEGYNCHSQQMIDDMRDALAMGSFGTNEESGSAYVGSLLHITLTKLCKYASLINNNLDEDIRVNHDSLMKVLLLQHISKALMFVKCTNSYLIGKGVVYEFNPDKGHCLKTGEWSAYICMKYGITFTEDEYEAIKVIDKDIDDKSSYYLSSLATVVKTANIITQMALRDTYKKNKKEETKEE